MRKIGISLVLGLLCWSCALFRDVNWGIEDKADNSIYPSAVIALAGYDENVSVDSTEIRRNEAIRAIKNYVGIYLYPKVDNLKIEVSIKESEYWYASRGLFVCGKAGEKYIYQPVINWKYDVLRKLEQPTPVDFVVQMTAAGEDVGEKSRTLTLRSINECVYAMRDGKKYYDFSMLFAAYVNEDHPIIQQILKEGLETDIIKSYKGYQGSREKNVYAQVLSLWDTLQKRGIRYSNLIESSQSSPVYFSQRVRTIGEALIYSQANCVDGTVLFASLLKAIGIDPVLVRIPGHMFLGFYMNKKHTKMEFLETTLLGSVEQQNDSTDLKQFRNVESYESFMKAMEMGRQTYDKNKDSVNFRMIDLREVRKYIKPVGM